MKRTATGAALAALAWLFASAGAQAQSLEWSVKANYLARFAAFVDWPSASFQSASSAINVCVVGVDPFGDALEQALSAQTINGRRLVARRLSRLARGSGCHIAYVAGSSEQSISQALAEVAGEAVLTVTDEARSSTRGVLHFTLFQNRVRFHIDNRLARRGGLDMSSRLLGLALSVQERD